MPHVVLLGDSIFDNAVYVPGSHSVIEHLRQLMPASWSATLLAVDGSVTRDVARQLSRLPEAATHLIVSVGGNDALHEAPVIWERVESMLGALSRLSQVQERFRSDYREMLDAVLAHQKTVTVCTVYDSPPGVEPPERTALITFNDVILREAFASGLDVIDLRLVCAQPNDYSELSPIEPSVQGGMKIAQAVIAAVSLDEKRRHSRVIA